MWKDHDILFRKQAASVILTDPVTNRSSKNYVCLVVCCNHEGVEHNDSKTRLQLVRSD